MKTCASKYARLVSYIGLFLTGH